MEILPKRIHEILKEKGVSSLYHANSVMASCAMLRNRCLLSPGSADKLGLYHSAQTAPRGRSSGGAAMSGEAEGGAMRRMARSVAGVIAARENAIRGA